MATFGGYVILVVGLSILLAMIGIQTTTGHILGTFGINIVPTSTNSTFSVDVTGFNGLNNSWFLGIFIGLTTIFGIVSGVRAYLGGTFGISETLKVTSVGGLIALIVLDLIAIFSYDYGGTLGRIMQIISVIIYLPLSIGAVIAAYDWIGGGR